MMQGEDLQKGGWYCSPKSPNLFRFEGTNAEGAYVFSRFNGTNPESPGELVTTIEIHNVDEFEPRVPGT